MWRMGVERSKVGWWMEKRCCGLSATTGSVCEATLPEAILNFSIANFL